jgi:hypothetical protein
MEQKVKVPKTFLEKEKTSRVYVLLDQASLETVKVKQIPLGSVLTEYIHAYFFFVGW